MSEPVASYTKKDLVDELAAKFKVSKRRTDLFLTELAEIAYREASNPNGFIVPGICKLDVRRRNERRARNPATGETLLIGAHDVLRVRPVKRAKDRVAPTPPGIVTVLPPEEEPATPPVAETPSPAPAVAASAAVTPAAIAPTPATPAAADALKFYSFNCPYCRSEIEVTSDCAGERINCPACHRGFTAPQPGQRARPDGKAPAAKAVAAPSEQFVSFLCKSCGQEIEAPIDMAGSQDECPSCGAGIMVPYMSEAGTTQALIDAAAPAAALEAAKSRTLRIELPDDF